MFCLHFARVGDTNLRVVYLWCILRSIGRHQNTPYYCVFNHRNLGSSFCSTNVKSGIANANSTRLTRRGRSTKNHHTSNTINYSRRTRYQPTSHEIQHIIHRLQQYTGLTHTTERAQKTDQQTQKNDLKKTPYRHTTFFHKLQSRCKAHHLL